MFQLSIKKEELLNALQIVAGAVDKKQSLAILSNFLLTIDASFLTITATDLEIEISAKVACEAQIEVEASKASSTVPAKKLIDIIRSLDDNTSPNIVCNQSVVTIKQGRSSFKLTTLPAEQYPISDDECNEVELNLPRTTLIQLLQSTHFAMSQQDVRVFLNGLYLEFESNRITAVATDGHRMAVNHYSCTNQTQGKLLVPKRAVQELLRLLPGSTDENVLLTAGKSHFNVVTNQFTFLSKLIEARFPPYAKVIPRDQNKQIIIACSVLKRALTRSIILAQEKTKAVTFHVQANQLTLIANNNEQEEAVETLEAQTSGDELKIGLNASYLLDVLNYFNEGEVKISLSQTDTSILIESVGNEQYQYIIMPMKI